MVDGVEKARLNPAERSSISFGADEDAELIEVKTTDSSGDLLLATHVLTSSGKNEAATVSIRLEGGQKLSLSFKRRPSEEHAGGDLLVEFRYRESDPRRVARLWWQQLRLRRSPEQETRGLWSGPSISTRHVLTASLVIAVICLTSYLAYVRLSSNETSGPQISSAQPPGPIPSLSGSPASGTSASGTPVSGNPDARVSNPPVTPLPTEAPIPPPKTKQPDKAPDKATASTSPAAQSGDEAVTDLTRSGNLVANLKLSEVKKVYVEVHGDSALSALRSNLVESFGASGVLNTTGADDADAALKIVVSQSSPQIEASARLINARGAVLWPKTGARHYSGDPTKVAAEIVKDLLSEIRRARTEH
jgi:hypothetical protein